MLLDIDPRLDLTQPIYDQVQRLAVKDSAVVAGIKKRKSNANAA